MIQPIEYLAIPMISSDLQGHQPICNPF